VESTLSVCRFRTPSPVSPHEHSHRAPEAYALNKDAQNLPQSRTMSGGLRHLWPQAAVRPYLSSPSGRAIFLGVNEDEERQTWRDYTNRHCPGLADVWDRGGRICWRCARWTEATEAEVPAILGTPGAGTAATVSPRRPHPATAWHKMKPTAGFCIPCGEGIATMQKEGHARRVVNTPTGGV